MSQMHKAEQNKPRLNVVKQQPRKPLHILLVDSDDDDSLALRREFDASRAAQLDFARDTETAARMVEREVYDLVAVDPVLPGGFALLKHLKDNHRWLATLVVTANQSPHFMRQAVKSRIDA